jgi:DNA repair protein RadA/Sms
VAGGLRIAEPAADLAVAAALVSALRDTPLPRDLVLFGEVALSGEVRAVAQTPARLREAERLGFRRVILPKTSGVQTTLEATALASVRALLPIFG